MIEQNHSADRSHSPDQPQVHEVDQPPIAEPIGEAPSRKDKLMRHAKRFGVAGFLFFFIKGLLWLLIPLLIALGWFGGK